MLSHQSVRDLQLLERSVVQTFNLLEHFKKWDDVANMLNPLYTMLVSFRRINNESKTNNNDSKTKDKKPAQSGIPASNMPLENAISSVMIC